MTCQVDHGAFLAKLREEGVPEALIHALAQGYAFMHWPGVLEGLEAELVAAASTGEDGP